MRGIRLRPEDELAAALCVRDDEQMLIISEFGYGKRIAYDNFNPHGRGTGGQIAYKVGEKTGEVVDAISVEMRDELVCITSQGNAVKLRLKEIPTMGKSAQGVRIVSISQPDFVVGTARVARES
jgi:DNA gyrase subunit A